MRNDRRVTVMLMALTAIAVGLFAKSLAVRLGVTFPGGPLADAISLVLACAALGAAAVLGSVWIGIRKYRLFSRFNRILNRPQVALCGMILIGFAGYDIVRKAREGSAYEWADGAIVALGSFFLCWVLLFWDRNATNVSAGDEG